MTPFLSSIARAFPVALLVTLALWGLLLARGDLRSLTLTGQVYLVAAVTCELALLGGGMLGLRRERAQRPGVPDAMLRRDRLDLALVLVLLGSVAGLGAGHFLHPQGGESLALVGGLLGFWLVSASPLSPLFILATLGGTAVVGGLALAVHQQPALPLLKLEAAALGMLMVASLVRRGIQAGGPPGWPRTFLTLALLLLAPCGLGLAWGERDGPLLGYLYLVGTLVGYHWVCLANPQTDGSPAEPTRSGCGCAFLGLGVLMAGMRALGQALRLASPLVAGLALLVMAALCAGGAVLGSRLARGSYRDRVEQAR